MEKGSLVRLRSPRHKITLEDEWYCHHWHHMTPMVYLGTRERSPAFAEVMTPDGLIKAVWKDYLTTHMRRTK